MSIYIPRKKYFREVKLYYYIAKKTAVERHSLLVEIYVEHAPSITICINWFCWCRNDNYYTKDKDHGRPIKEFEDKELEMLLDENPWQTQNELADTLNVTQQCISQRLKGIGMIRKLCNWLPYELTERDIQRQKLICEFLL